MSRLRMVGAFAALIGVVVAGLPVAEAGAEVNLGVSLNRSTVPITHSDERLAYRAVVTNVTSAAATVGQELTCNNGSWFGNPAPTFEFQWLRNGVVIPGAIDQTYVISAADEGKSLQCEVIGTNEPVGGPSPLSSATASVPPVVVEPVPTALPPSGLGLPSAVRSGPLTEVGAKLTCEPSAEPTETWIGFASAAATPGNNVLTDVITTEGAGSTIQGSKVVQGISMIYGTFSVGQVVRAKSTSGVAGTVVSPGTTITAVRLATHELELSVPAKASSAIDLFAGAQPFAAGQEIEGAGIPAGTTITAVSGSQLTLSANVSSSASRIALWGPGLGGSTWHFRWLRNGRPIVGGEDPTYIVQSADTEPPSIVQCEAIARDAAGDEAVAISTVQPTAPSPPAPYVSVSPKDTVTASVENQTTGQVAVEVQFPAGTKPLRATGTGWKCAKALSTAECLRSDPLAAGASYPSIELVTQVGEAAPEPLVTKVVASGGGASLPVMAEDEVSGILPAVHFGFQAFDTAVLDSTGADYTQAGGHPFSAGTAFIFNEHVRAEVGEHGLRAATGFARVISIDTPPGFVGNVQALPEKCETVADLLELPSACPEVSAVGGITLETKQATFKNLPIYAIEPEFGAPAQFAFGINSFEPGFAYTLTPELRASENYAISLVSAPIQKAPQLFGAVAELCSFGAKLGPSAGSNKKETEFKGCRQASEPEAQQKPLVTNPTSCSGSPPVTTARADSWEEPGNFQRAQFTSPALTDCDAVPFEPQISISPTSRRADSPTGMKVEINMPTNGLEENEGIAQANLDNATVSLPVGMSVNPSLAAGLGVCTEAEIGLGTNDEPQCPESSRIGSAEVSTPLLEEPLSGTVYLAKQGENPFHSLLALYLVFESKREGITIKVAGKVTPDPVTGQLTASFTNNPQAPFSSLSVRFASGERAPLINPPACGNYTVESHLSPWSAVDPANPTSAEMVTSQSKFAVTQGPGGKACPSQALEPKLKAGLANPFAGTTSPFITELSREDGTQRFSGLDLTLPRGLTAYLTGVPYCPDATLASIPSAEGTGAAEIASPACPAASQIGAVSVAAGAGSTPLTVNTGRVYLAGPYKGAPLSLAIVTPAVAGPFDLGNVVVRAALEVNPETAEITAKSDPIPTIVHGITLDVRQIRVSIDRSHFALAPTNCEASAIGATVTGERGATSSVQTHFQVTGCDTLKFKPKLKISLKGSTKHTGHPALKAVVTYPKQGAYANIARAQVNLPHSEFIDQGNLDKTCTRPVLLAGNCTSRSIYGKAKAWTPLLEKPLEGPVYLVGGYGYKLPALVAELNGQIRVLLVGKVDSGPNHGIRNTFETVPDAPVSRFVLEMKGGKKYSLLENSENLCLKPQRGVARFTAQNGLVDQFRPVIANGCKKKHHKGAHHKKKGPSKKGSGGKRGKK